MCWDFLKGNPRLKPKAAGGKPLSFKTKMDGIMGRKMGKIPGSLRRNAYVRNSRLLLWSPGCPDDGFFFHIVHHFITDIFPGRTVCHWRAFRKQGKQECKKKCQYLH